MCSVKKDSKKEPRSKSTGTLIAGFGMMSIWCQLVCKIWIVLCSHSGWPWTSRQGKICYRYLSPPPILWFPFWESKKRHHQVPDCLVPIWSARDHHLLSPAHMPSPTCTARLNTNLCSRWIEHEVTAYVNFLNLRRSLIMFVMCACDPRPIIYNFG